MAQTKLNSLFWTDRKLSPQEQNALLVATFRRVFGTEEGKIALNTLLADLFLFERTHTKREHALNEYAKFFIRERLGVCDTKALSDFIAETAASGRV
jgi:hypothetical protein